MWQYCTLAVVKANRHVTIQGGCVQHPTTPPLLMKHMVASPQEKRSATHLSGLKHDGIFRYGVDEPRMEALRFSLLNDCGHGTSRRRLSRRCAIALRRHTEKIGKGNNGQGRVCDDCRSEGLGSVSYGHDGEKFTNRTNPSASTRNVAID
jgi:hypothetical protein